MGAEDLEAVYYGALVKDAGCGACGAVLARFFADDEPVPRLDLNLVDLHSPRNVAAWAWSRLRLDPGMPARLARLAAFASRCGPVAHEAMSAHCEVAADFAAGLGFGHHVQDAVHYQYERHDGRSPAFRRPAETIPRPAKILHLAPAADLVRGLSGTEAAAARFGRTSGSAADRANRQDAAAAVVSAEACALLHKALPRKRLAERYSHDADRVRALTDERFLRAHDADLVSSGSARTVQDSAPVCPMRARRAPSARCQS